jgi:hypothetical protein
MTWRYVIGFAAILVVINNYLANIRRTMLRAENIPKGRREPMKIGLHEQEIRVLSRVG